MHALVAFLLTATVHATVAEPYIGQPGKDVVWVPTPEVLVEQMLDMAKVTRRDYVIDLGSGDGRNVIAAARRGASALGIEYDAGLVELARRNAAAAGVAKRARFKRGDMYKADISKATVLVLFLLPNNLEQLKPAFERLKPGTRIVTNSYEIPGWEAEEVATSENGCASWCIAYLYVIPPKVKRPISQSPPSSYSSSVASVL